MALPDWSMTSLTQVGFYEDGSDFGAQEVMRVYSEPEVAVYQAGKRQGLLTASKAHFLFVRCRCYIADVSIATRSHVQKCRHWEFTCSRILSK